MRKPSFFEKYADEYDALTEAGSRAVSHGKEVDALVERFRPSRVLDAGCATGLTTSLFASRGVTAVGLDRSRSMLKQARAIHGGEGANCSFRYGRFETLPSSMNGAFDLVVCLANSIVGVETVLGLRQSLDCFGRILLPGGSLVLQLLNYRALRAGDIMPVRATTREGVIYLRFLERLRHRVALHIVRVNNRVVPPSFEVFRSESAIFDTRTVVSGLRKAGFKDVKLYADLRLSAPFKKTSRDLVITGTRTR